MSQSQRPEGIARPPWAGSLSNRGAASLLHTYARYPIELVAGHGCRVSDSSGREYLDFIAGIAVNVLGHGHPAITAAIRDATVKLLHVSNLYWTEPMVRLAERLTAAAGMDKAFFCNSGAEAVEAGIKLGRRTKPNRTRTICFERSFHGRTLGALSMTAQAHYREPFEPLLPQIEALPYGDFQAVEESLTGDVALVIVEPIQGEGGMRPAPPGWLSRLRSLCDEHGIFLLFDEVQSGIGRTGTFFAYQAEDVVPDAVACAKALAGGLPMGALLARGSAADAFRPGDHASTFGGGPLIASVANAVLDEVLSEGFLAAVVDKGRILRSGLEELTTKHRLPSSVRGRGLMLGLALSRAAAASVVAAGHERGLLLCPAGADVVRFVPPLIISEAEIASGLALFDDALGDVENDRPSREASG